MVISSKNLKTTFHFSGSLISFLDKKAHYFSSKIRYLLDHGQIELFGGGIYEPIFPFIPKEDRQTQLLMMNRLLNHLYGYNPAGAWTTEFAWEPSLALDYSKSRLQYTCLPKEHFLLAGIEEKEISGYFITEEEGRKIAIFPLNSTLNNLMQTFNPKEFIENISTNLQVLVFDTRDLNDDNFKWLTYFFKSLR